MKTSSFRVSARKPGAISIALREGSARKYSGFIGPSYKKLAPPEDLFIRYKLNRRVSVGQYTREYQECVLDGLDPFKVYRELSNLVPDQEPILCCYCRPGIFCHRRLVANWLEIALGEPILEINSKSTNLEGEY